MNIFNTKISKEQAKDTGMAMVLILLILGFLLKNTLFFKLAIPVLVLDMIFPMIYKPVAIIWLGFSHLLGTVVSKILLSIVFFLIVTTIGGIRRLFGIDSLKLKEFKKGTESVMKTRNITFTREQIENVY
ncbi:hypothetical protein H8E88_07130 [candidate division KSB1 bacterium]|nr:hypothetical protein [candidate division KSB1 bacterium]